VRGAGATNATYAFGAENSSQTALFTVRNDGAVNVSNGLFTASAGIAIGSGYNATLVAGDVALVSNAGYGIVSADTTRAIAITNAGTTINDGLTVTTAGSSNTIVTNSAGYVGIGVVPSSYRLEVNGTIYTSSGGVRFPDGTTQTTAFTGTASVNANSLTGTTLASNVVNSSLTSVGTLSSLTVSGDLTVDTSTLKVDSANNRVGIGTSSPSNQFSVNSTVATIASVAQISHPAGDWGLVLKRTANDTGSSNLAFLKSRGEAATAMVSGDSVGRVAWHAVVDGIGTTSQLAEIGVLNTTVSAGAADSNLLFWTKPLAGSLTERMRITSAGNVGVGTTSPTNYGAGYRTISANGTSSGVFEIRANDTVRGLIVGDATDLQIQASGATPMRFFTNGNERMRIASDGVVSIGGNTALHAGNYGSYALPLSGGTLTGVVNTSAASQTINTTTPGTGTYQLNFIGQATSDYAHAITWGWGSSGAQAGVYVQSSGSYGTKMYLATTDSFATGAKTAVSIDHSGNTNIVRGALTQGGNQVLHAGNYTSYPIMYYPGGVFTGNFQDLTDVSGELRIDQVNNINAGGYSNQPPNVYTYGGVLSWRLVNHSFQLYASHTGDLTFKTQWNNDNYSGWRRILHEANYTSFAPSLTGSGASGTWGISVTGSAGSAGSATTSTTQAHSDTSTNIATTAWVRNILGARTTGGTADWNDVSNTRPGTGYTLLLGTATNGMGGGNYYHPFNLEYSSNNGTGNVTQMAYAYGSPANEMYMRGRYNGSWTGWVRFINSGNYTSYSPSLTGSGASGTWGINVTGTSGSISGYNNPTTASTANTIAYRDGNGDLSCREVVLTGGTNTATPTRLVAIYPGTNQLTNYTPAAVSEAIRTAASGTWGINVTGQSRAVYDSGYGVTEQTWHQESGTFAGYSGWASYIINNHGSGSSYYNQTLIMPFWSAPQYSRLEGGTFRGPYTILSTENYGSYALPLSGGTVTGTTYFRSNIGSGAYSGSSSNPPLQAFCNDNGSAFMSFHRSGLYAVNMGLDPDNVLRIGGWSASSNRFQMDMSGNLTMAGNVTAFSDIRLKANIRKISGALSKVRRLRGVTFTRIDQEDKERRHAGVIAQEMEQEHPEVVYEDAAGMKNVAYGNSIGLLIEAIKELADMVERRH